jgi:hypothetical protein
VADTIGDLKTVYDTLPSDGTVKPVSSASVSSLSAVPRENIMTFAILNGAMALSFDPVGELTDAIDVAARLTAIVVDADNNDVSTIASACTGLTLLGKFYSKFKTFADEAKAKKVGAGIDALLALIAIAPSCYHFFELSRDPVSKQRTLGFMDETGNLCNYLQRIASFGVAMSEGTVKAGFAVAMGVLVLSWGTMQITEASAESAG